jgi:hypothetical protein
MYSHATDTNAIQANQDRRQKVYLNHLMLEQQNVSYWLIV